MNLLVRWGKFNLVGAMGAGAQLGSLAILIRVLPGHYLVASAIALEITLLHNFVWHVHYTWSDRARDQGRDRRRDRRCQRGQRSVLAGQCARFHLSNGIVSLAGNLALMKALVDGARLPIVEANAIAIMCCSLVNFCLGEIWVFGIRHWQPKAG